MPYFVRSSFLLRYIVYPMLRWRYKTNEKVIYLTFDDGPIPNVTPWVLEQLALHKAKATFFCIGDNVQKNGAIYQQIINSGHRVGNHTQHHCNGWLTDKATYLADVVTCSGLVQSSLFRPPYGRISRAQIKAILGDEMGIGINQIIMWDVLSADFDTQITPEQCAANVVRNAKAGSIVVFHDSEKAFPRLQHALPVVLSYFGNLGFRFDILP